MYKVPNRNALPVRPQGQYNNANVAKKGSDHLLMLRHINLLRNPNLKTRAKKLKNKGINVKDNFTFIAHVVGYEDPSFGQSSQIVLRKPHSKNNSKSNSTKLNLHGVNHVWNLTYPNIGLKPWEMPPFKQVLRQKLQGVGENIYKSHLAKTKRNIENSINSKFHPPLATATSLGVLRVE